MLGLANSAERIDIEAVGVPSHNPDAISSVSGIDGTSWNNGRPCGVADGLQFSKHLVETQCDVTNNIFAHKPAGSCRGSNSENFRPEVAVIVLAFSLAG